MINISDKIFIGTESDCSFGISNGLAMVHACKHPCHTKAVGYKGSLPKSHPYYLILEKPNHLFLNMVDMEQELLPEFANPIMQAALNFIERYIKDHQIVIHCNQGLSRSPSIALVYLANKGMIDNNNINEAVKAFTKLYPYYRPASGILKYMAHNWNYLMKL